METIKLINVLQQLREDLKNELILLENNLEQLKENWDLNNDLILDKEDLYSIKAQQYNAIHETIRRLLNIK